MTMPKQKPGRSKQDYGTPPEFLAAVKRRLSIPDFYRDLAASPENAVCKRYYSVADNALTQPWNTSPHNMSMWVLNEWNWLNPPFSDIEPWVRMAYESAKHTDAQTAVLIPLGCPNWWRDWVDGKARVLMLNGRLKFVGCKDYYPKDTALLLYGPAVTPGYEVWKWQ